MTTKGWPLNYYAQIIVNFAVSQTKTMFCVLKRIVSMSTQNKSKNGPKIVLTFSIVSLY